MFSNIFSNAKANIKGGKKYPKINGTITFKETKNGKIKKESRSVPQSLWRDFWTVP